MELLLSNLNYASLFSFFFIAVVLNVFFIRLKFNRIHNIQDIHFEDTSRLGGFVVFVLFFVFEIFFIKYMDHITWFLVMIMLTPALLEDINITSHPNFRLTVMLLCSFFIVINMPQLPQFNFGNLNFIVNHTLFQIFFFSFSIVAVMNGQNMLDGVHGLSAVQGICVFLCILILGLHLNHLPYVLTSFVLVLLLISFLLFNYPVGKIFLGDLGSYFLALLGSFIIIDIFAQNPQLPTWLAVIILFYPTFEVMFSIIRKFISKKSPIYPDDKHLHSLIFNFFKNKRKKSPKISNILVMPVLILLWLSPILFFIFSLRYSFFLTPSIFILAFIYLAYYFAFRKFNNGGQLR